MVDMAPGAVGNTDAARPDDEIRRLRAELATSRAVSARALARATRLAQLVIALGKVTEVADVLDCAVCEVAELFDADVAAVLTPPEDGDDGLLLAAQWGIAGRHLPPGAVDRPAAAQRLTSVFPVAAAPVEENAAPDWLVVTEPRHLAWGLLTVRDEHLGYLLLARREDRPFDTADVQELIGVVSRISLAIDNGRLYRRSQEQLHRLQRLNTVTAGLAGMVDVATAARNIVETLIEHVPVAGAAVYLNNAHGEELAAAGGAEWPRNITADRLPALPGVLSMSLGAQDPSAGRLLITGGPAPGTDARTFLEHLVDVGGLVLEKALLFRRIRMQAETDVLTGMPNRAFFLESLAATLNRCRHLGTDVAVLFIDMDGFKAVNDTYGHDAGDQLLVTAAQRLTDAAGLSALAARLGGDEFVVACADLTAEQAELLAERIERAVSVPYQLRLPTGEVEVVAGCSIGLGLAADRGYDPSLLLSGADAAMYAVKQHRRAARRAATADR
ncbi:sensor domain-containing diguanylate cyclase [Actinoplanes sp. NEAU-A12]|uniref:Sensor domain-containing diguanylate cyclase n=1 Tax=Actinoplanes sandaracinus TaxID=3045177 RepID=A0ABT6WWY6_9ACTN|nr:sensor domain-containing diguanylate cyclase [Actinoplanes sandaracinus]MDI6104245.1 sensor domain-containing diguanylate cyclase [Actinoplanes sandaracinus]